MQIYNCTFIFTSLSMGGTNMFPYKLLIIDEWAFKTKPPWRLYAPREYLGIVWHKQGIRKYTLKYVNLSTYAGVCAHTNVCAVVSTLLYSRTLGPCYLKSIIKAIVFIHAGERKGHGKRWENFCFYSKYLLAWFFFQCSWMPQILITLTQFFEMKPEIPEEKDCSFNPTQWFQSHGYEMKHVKAIYINQYQFELYHTEVALVWI